eukprot:TRINITY_DN5354_c0_g1_i10.p1 TRINITY_DN5354_c0_g1~~TRINITY_DN5354_c0_g1_i10.p1  ORF type:complete len:458 (-),score=92.20 TRINITY_DN5354_c0_g1_i10:220-1407(-)
MEELQNLPEATAKGIASKLIYPSIVGKQLMKTAKENLAIKKKGESKYLTYQNDNDCTMHAITMNAVAVFIALCKRPLMEETVKKVDVLSYLSHIVCSELDNKNSPIDQCSIILLELAEWHCFTNIERSITLKKSKGMKKLWIMNDLIMSIENDSFECRVEIRNIVSCSSFTVKLDEVSHRPHKSLEENRKAIASLRSTKQYNPSANPLPIIDPEYIVNNFSGLMNVDAKALLWQAVEMSEEVEKLLGELDKISVYDECAVAVLYVPPHFGVEEEIYSVKKWSERFEEFVAPLGSLVKDSEKEEYSLLWQNEFTKIIVHVNVFCAIHEATDAKATIKKTKKCIEDDSVWIIWNDSGKRFPITLFKDKKAVAFIVIEPLEDHYCRIETHSVSSLVDE